MSLPKLTLLLSGLPLRRVVDLATPALKAQTKCLGILE